MNKDNYNKAMDKIKASDEFKSRIMTSVSSEQTRKNRFRFNKIIAVAAMFALIISSVYFTSILRNPVDKHTAGEFKITGEADPNSQMSYILVLYLDGYSYEDSGWISYSINENLENMDNIKGEKIGEVTLDLKGKTYEGTPPDFSSTYGLGTQIYEVKGVKRENAVLMVSGEMNHILYRSRKAVASENDPIGLTVEEVIHMISDAPIISSVELRNEIDGSWMRTSYDNRLLELLNRDIKDRDILSYKEMGTPDGEPSYRIPVNLMFGDGAVLHMQVYPETNIAYIFGGYINISEELANRFEELYRLGNEYSKITDIVGYELSELGYFKFANHMTGEEIISPDPLWSGEVLYGMLNYYSVDEASSDLDGNLVITVKMGESVESSKELEIYEGTDKNLFFKVDGKIYKIVKGSLQYKDLLIYQENYTSY
ncbi:hypothetical protein [Tissierella sp. Yu-01]|uniref:hypothetical protein n=1 Tax=Tissierella sp. Yu-01 TaxID=3035694 RepID=UPI00240D96FB|nr:hypothetical protein [Tissierella sp. Yu-01]WFA08785.1 hypothetical protein P3962_13820 [Tissierella sp. Yu-01]